MTESSLQIVFSDTGEGYEVDVFGWFDVTIRHLGMILRCSFLQESGAWQEFGAELSHFPLNTAATIFFEQATPYLRLQAYCYDHLGHTALRIWLENQEPDPDGSKFEFSIPAEAASLNQLGKLLAGWQLHDTPELLWQAQTS